MSAAESFEFNTLHKGIGVRVLLVEFHELAVEDFHSRLQMLSASRLITRIDATPLTGAPWTFETFRHGVVFLRLRERHMRDDLSPVVEAFLAQLAAFRAVTVIPITCRRALIDHFHLPLSRVSPMYLDTSFVQDDLLHILGACAFSGPARRRIAKVDAPAELSLAGT